MATLLLSLGVPMLLAGDEIGPHAARQQQRLLPGQRDLLARLGECSPRRRGAARVRPLPDQFPAQRTGCFRGRASFVARCVSEAGLKDITWVTPAGIEATDEDWAQSGRIVARLCAVRRRRRVLHAGGPARHRRKLSGDDERLSRRSRFPRSRSCRRRSCWEALVDTAEPTGRRASRAAMEAGRSLSAARAFLRAVHQPRARCRRARLRGGVAEATGCGGPKPARSTPRDG